MKYVCLFIFLLGAVGYDIDWRRIPNLWCLPGAFAGMIISFMEGGVHGGLSSFLGILVPMAVLFVFFVFRILGAGDVKMLSVIGAFIWLDVIWVLIYAFVITAAYGVFVFAVRVIRQRPFAWTRICMSIPIAAGTILFVVGGRFI